MNILLATCAAPVMSPFYTGEKRPPLGLGFLMAILRDQGHHVFFLDNYLRRTGLPDSTYLRENQIDLVGIYANTICYRETERVLRMLQRLRESAKWDGKIVVGGPHASVAPDTIPDFVDHVVLGEGEKAILDIVAGRGSRVLSSPRIKDLDSLPRPTYDLFAELPYHFTAPWIPAEPVFTMNTSRGCPYQCAFCSVSSLWGTEYRFFSADRVVDDAAYLAREHGARGIYFREDNFTVNRSRVVDFCEQLLTKDLRMYWMCETRVDSLDRDLLALMQRAGCTGVYLGIESGSQRVLDLLQKDITVQQSENVVRWCRDLGINTYASFIVGVPTETPDERQETIDFSKRIAPTTSGFNVFVGIPRSPLYRHVLQNDLFEHIDEVGLVYLHGHDDLVDRFYGGNDCMKVPTRRRRAAIHLCGVAGGLKSAVLSGYRRLTGAGSDA